MNRLEILVEEQSMEALLKVLLPQILPNGWTVGTNVFIRPHQGKGDLQKSIPIKFKAFSRLPQKTGFIILQDQDANDCKNLKAELVALCQQNNMGNACPFKVRIVCHELEAWYLGDVKALSSVFPHKFKAKQFENKNMCKDPDSVINPKKQLKNIVGEYAQIATASRIANKMVVNNNRSESFKQFICAVEMLTN